MATLEEALRLARDCEQAGNPERAEGVYRDIVRALPDHVEAWYRLGHVLRDLGRLRDAICAYRRTQELQPGATQVTIHLAMTCAALGQRGESMALLQELARAQPGMPESFSNLGAAASLLGAYQEALGYYGRALELRPDLAEVHLNRALAWLVLGNFEEGWREYEWRWHCPPQGPFGPAAENRWDGSPLEGRTILLTGEQALGDVLQFVRYASLVKARGGRVICQCPPALTRLLTGCPGIDLLVPQGAALPGFDVQAPLLSLPYLLGTRLDTVPADVPYLFADPGLIEHWRRELAPVQGLRVGIAWQGQRGRPWDQAHRSIPLAHFEPLARVPGVHLVSLQKGPGTEQVEALAGRFPVITLGPHVDLTAGAFMDTAAIMKNLDLVITSDTALAHLAGALAVPAWVVLSAAPDWRWLLDREDSPWYPTLRLFRQKNQGDWPEVFARMAGALGTLTRERNPPRTLLVETSPGELLDRIALLEVRLERSRRAEERGHDERALARLCAWRARLLQHSESVALLAAELKRLGGERADLEETLRACERTQDFGRQFIEAARRARQIDDRREAVRRNLDGVCRHP